MMPIKQTFAIKGGHVRRGRSLHSHPADGTIARIGGDDWGMSFPDPTPETHIQWIVRYGDIESVRFSIASILESYEYLLDPHITKAEAVRRLGMLREGYKVLLKEGRLPENTS